MNKNFGRLNLEGQLERLEEYKTKPVNSEDLRMTGLHLADFYWVTNYQEVREKIEGIVISYADKTIQKMLEDVKQKLPRTSGQLTYTGWGTLRF